VQGGCEAGAPASNVGQLAEVLAVFVVAALALANRLDAPTWRLPGSFGYDANRAVKAGDIEGPVKIARGARRNTTPK